MKLFVNLFGMVLAGVLGYLMEPNLRFQLTGMKPSATEIASRGKIVLKTSEGSEPIELDQLTADQLPQRILIKSSVKITNSATGVTMTLDAGNRVKLVGIEAANAIVGLDEGSSTGKIPITQTDLLDQLTANPPSAIKKPTPVVVPPPDATAPPVTPIPVVPDVTTPPVMPEPPPVAQPETDTTPAIPDPVPPPQPMPEPATESAPPPDATPTAAGPEQVVKIMQDSLRAKQIKRFTLEEVTEWKAGPDEMVDGESYQTGTAAYKETTILGAKIMRGKALIKGGKVQRWIWPTSGVQID